MIYREREIIMLKKVMKSLKARKVIRQRRREHKM